MEITSLLLGLFFGIISGAAIVYFALKSGNVPRKKYDEVHQNFIRKEADLQNFQLKKDELEKMILQEKERSNQQAEILKEVQQNLARINAVNENQNEQIIRQSEINAKQAGEIEMLQTEKLRLSELKSELSAQNENLKKLLDNQKEEIVKLQEAAKNEFKNIANELFEEKSKKFTDANKENLDILLRPLGENLENFKKRVNEVYENETRERYSLNATIKLMMEQTNKISQEANNLATALKGQTKTQGDWGEMILERILEDSGLSKNREYFAQMTIRSEDGESQRPDFVLKLPGNQMVVIDSKVSLNAYERMISAENEDIRKQNLGLHIAAVKKHIDVLAQKRYDNLKESLDFTIMFIPIEPAFLTAVQSDPQLWNYAYQKHIIMLSPTNLIAYLKLISDVWKRADQNKNAEEIARQAGALYDKFEGFVSDLLKIGKKMDDAKSDYENAMRKLSSGRGNLVGSVQKLKQLGASTKKHLPEMLLERADEEFPTELPTQDENKNKQ